MQSARFTILLLILVTLFIGLPASDAHSAVGWTEHAMRAPSIAPAQAQPVASIMTRNEGSFGSSDDPNGDDDYYWLDVGTGKRITIDITGIPAGANYRLTLLRFIPPDQYKVEGDSNQAGNGSEHVIYTSPTTTRYYVRVCKLTGSTAADTYILKVTLT
jgi:hypothetical protein